MKQDIQGDMVFDTSVLVELFSGSQSGNLVKEALIDGSVRAITTELNITELRYILCRKIGWAKAKESVEHLLNSGYLKVLNIEGFAEHASRIKCDRSLSLVDSFAIAAGEELKLDVLFAKREEELGREARKKAFNIKIVFLEGLR